MSIPTGFVLPPGGIYTEIRGIRQSPDGGHVVRDAAIALWGRAWDELRCVVIGLPRV